jgi:hypothetical protein
MQLSKPGKKILSPVLILASALFMVLLAGCGATVETNGNTTTVNLSNNGTSQVTFATLKHSPVGTSDLSWNAESHQLTVKISLTGLAPNSSHAVHIHAGTCAADGAIVYPLNPVVADAKGDATSETTIANVRNGIPATGWYINIHNGLNMTAIEHMPISCGNITHSDSMKNDNNQSVRVTMGGSIAPNESANGKAELMTVNGKLALKITLTGLQPNSKHIAHIHAGSCEAQGAVLVMLNPVVADAQGNGTSLTTINQMPSSASGMYVNVHLGATMADLNQSVFFDPIACGNVPVSN